MNLFVKKYLLRGRLIKILYHLMRYLISYIIVNIKFFFLKYTRQLYFDNESNIDESNQYD